MKSCLSWESSWIKDKKQGAASFARLFHDRLSAKADDVGNLNADSIRLSLDRAGSGCAASRSANLMDSSEP